MKKKIFIFYFIITIIFLGMLIKLEFATDTYAVFNFNKEEVFMQYAMSGRFITGIIFKFFKLINVPEIIMYELSFAFAVFCATLSQYILYKIIEKVVKSKLLKILIPTLIIINPFSIELFLFIEKGIMWFGILMCILATNQTIRFFETKLKKHIIFALIFMFLANCSYQGGVGIFLSISLVFILKYSKNIKQFVVNNFIVGIIYAIPALLDLVLVKILYKASRINGQVVLLDSMKLIIQNTQNMYLKMYDLLPKYVFILLILFTFVVFCCKILKDNKRFSNVLSFFYIIIGITFVAIAPQIVQPTHLIWFSPRSTYSFASMYGILILYLAMNYEVGYIIKNLILLISFLLIIFQVQKFITIEKDRYILNKNDKEITMQIIEQIENYEKQTGNIINKISWYQDEKANYSYNGIFVTSDMNVKCYSSDWSTVEILKYYLKRNIKLEKKDEKLEEFFKSKNWNEFNIEQILFDKNKLNLCNY